MQGAAINGEIYETSPPKEKRGEIQSIIESQSFLIAAMCERVIQLTEHLSPLLSPDLDQKESADSETKKIPSSELASKLMSNNAQLLELNDKIQDLKRRIDL